MPHFLLEVQPGVVEHYRRRFKIKGKPLSPQLEIDASIRLEPSDIKSGLVDVLMHKHNVDPACIALLRALGPECQMAIPSSPKRSAELPKEVRQILRVIVDWGSLPDGRAMILQSAFQKEEIPCVTLDSVCEAWAAGVKARSDPKTRKRVKRPALRNQVPPIQVPELDGVPRWEQAPLPQSRTSIKLRGASKLEPDVLIRAKRLAFRRLKNPRDKTAVGRRIQRRSEEPIENAAIKTDSQFIAPTHSVENDVLPGASDVYGQDLEMEASNTENIARDPIFPKHTNAQGAETVQGSGRAEHLEIRQRPLKRGTSRADGKKKVQIRIPSTKNLSRLTRSKVRPTSKVSQTAPGRKQSIPTAEVGLGAIKIMVDRARGFEHIAPPLLTREPPFATPNARLWAGLVPDLTKMKPSPREQ